MSQEFWIPLEFTDMQSPYPDVECTKIYVPDYCPFCGATIDIVETGDKTIGGVVMSPCEHFHDYPQFWVSRIKNINVTNTKATGGKCTVCNLYNEYQSGPYTCYYCRNRA